MSLIFFVGAGLMMPQVSFMASPALSSESKRGNSHVRSLRADRRTPHAPPTRKHPGFILVPDRVEEPISVSVQQTVITPPVEPKKTSVNRIYVRPRWVETESGVLLLEPGYWTEVGPRPEY